MDLIEVRFEQALRYGFMDELNPGVVGESLPEHERDLLRQLLTALRGLRYGSVTLIVHEGRLVEIQKTEKIRTGSLKSKDDRTGKMRVREVPGRDL